jgi:hypothetical protein
MSNHFQPGIKVKLEIVARGNSQPAKWKHNAKSGGRDHRQRKEQQRGTRGFSGRHAQREYRTLGRKLPLCVQQCSTFFLADPLVTNRK